MASDPILELADSILPALKEIERQPRSVVVEKIAEKLRSRLKRVVIVYEWSNVYNDWAEAGEFASDNEASIFENSVLCRRSAKFKRSTHFVLESKKGGV